MGDQGWSQELPASGVGRRGHAKQVRSVQIPKGLFN